MNENQTKAIRPSKKQRELLTFIEAFIGKHGYSPSYREIMVGCDYTSVATVALHINSLIKRGHLRKRDRSARSLEVVKESADAVKPTTNQVQPDEEKWLVEKVEHYFKQAEAAAELPPRIIEELTILISSLRVLGMEGAAQSFVPRLSTLKEREGAEPTS